MKPWKLIASKTLFKNDRITVQEDELILPNGKKTTYVHTPSETDSVIIIALNTKNEIILQREYSHPTSEILWQLPGGSMEKGETVEQAVVRELAEESGYGARKTEILGYFFTQNRKSNQKQFVALCTNLYEHKLSHDPDEFIETHWKPFTVVQDMIKQNEFHNINLLAALNVWLYHKTNVS